MADFPWLSPHLDVGSTAVTAVLAVVYLVLGPLRGRGRYRQLVRDRAAGGSRVLLDYYRRALVRQVVASVLVVLTVALSPGVSAADLGLRLPAGGRALEVWGLTAYMCLLVLVSGLVMRRRALRGRTVPGQSIFSALLPATAPERRRGAAVALGAGVSEELVFRGLFTAAAVSLFGLHAVAAAALVSVLFGAAHLYQGWRGVLGTALIGAIFAWTTLRSQSLLPAVIIHTVVDLRAIVLVPAQRPDAVSRRRRRRERPVPASRPDPARGADEEPVLP